MHVESAKQIVDTLRVHFNVRLSPEEFDIVVRRVMYAAGRLPNMHDDEFLSMLFIESAEGPCVSFSTLKRTVDRIAKRVQREHAHRALPAEEVMQPAPDRKGAEISERIAQFIEHLYSSFGMRETLMFQMTYVEEQRIEDVAVCLNLKKTAAYELRRKVKEEFVRFWGESE